MLVCECNGGGSVFCNWLYCFREEIKYVLACIGVVT